MSAHSVNYRLPDQSHSTARVAPLWAFIFELGYFNAMNCGLVPPRECLNSFLKTGRSAEASWEPFEIDTEEYAALEAQLLNPDLSALSKYSMHGWQTFTRDPALDQYDDLAQWQAKAREKHLQAWQQQMARLQHEMVMRAHKG